MKILKYSVFFLVLFLAGFYSCDKIDGPYTENIDGGDTAQVVRKILLEEFTGHKCPNCPTAAKIAHDLQDISGSQLIVISVHAGILAHADGSGDFTADYNTQLGDDLFNYYGFIGVPNGLVNRSGYNGSTVISPGDWNSVVASLWNVPQDAMLYIDHSYIDASRELDIDVEAEFFNSLLGPVMLSIYITEDSLSSPQKNNDPAISPDDVIMDYNHMHVLRDAVNGTWGDTLVNGVTLTDQPYTKSFSYTLDKDWDENNCNIVAFVYYLDNKEIIQAEEIHVK